MPHAPQRAAGRNNAALQQAALPHVCSLPSASQCQTLADMALVSINNTPQPFLHATRCCLRHTVLSISNPVFQTAQGCSKTYLKGVLLSRYLLSSNTPMLHVYLHAHSAKRRHSLRFGGTCRRHALFLLRTSLLLAPATCIMCICI